MSNQTAPRTIYTCPMHPQIERDRPGNCPICGMTLEPKSPAAGGRRKRGTAKHDAAKFP